MKGSWEPGRTCQAGHSLGRARIQNEQGELWEKRTTLSGDGETSLQSSSVIRAEWQVGAMPRRTWDAKIKIWNFVQVFEPGATCTKQRLGECNLATPCQAVSSRGQETLGDLNRSLGIRGKGPSQVGSWKSSKERQTRRCDSSAYPACTQL